MSDGWRWAGAMSTGTSHARHRTLCQDSATCISFATPAGPLLVAVVSDGAGSASHSRRGSRMVCHGFMRAMARYLSDAAECEIPDEEVIRGFMDGIRDRIAIAARRAHRSRRAFAATLVAIIAAPNWTLIAHVGDGACAVSTTESGPWLVPSWPWHGEYASTTAFVTEDPEPRLRLTVLPHGIHRFAVFSDGLERMVLDHERKRAFAPFFERMLLPLQRSQGRGRDRALSQALRKFLAGRAVTERTDDDTSLVLGCRI